MPYVTTTTTIRPNASVLFFVDTMPCRSDTPLYTVPGFTTRHYTVSADRLTIVDQYTWDNRTDEAAYKAADPRNNTPSFDAARIAYNTANTIQETTLSFETTP